MQRVESDQTISDSRLSSNKGRDGGSVIVNGHIMWSPWTQRRLLRIGAPLVTITLLLSPIFLIAIKANDQTELMRLSSRKESLTQKASVTNKVTHKMSLNKYVTSTIVDVNGTTYSDDRNFSIKISDSLSNHYSAVVGITVKQSRAP